MENIDLKLLQKEVQDTWAKTQCGAARHWITLEQWNEAQAIWAAWAEAVKKWEQAWAEMHKEGV